MSTRKSTGAPANTSTAMICKGCCRAEEAVSVAGRGEQPLASGGVPQSRSGILVVLQEAGRASRLQEEERATEFYRGGAVGIADAGRGHGQECTSGLPLMIALSYGPYETVFRLP